MSDKWEYKIVQPEKGGGITGADIRAHSAEFLNKYGHLRPGTYDITKLPYSKDPRYFSIDQSVSTCPCPNYF